MGRQEGTVRLPPTPPGYQPNISVIYQRVADILVISLLSRLIRYQADNRADMALPDITPPLISCTCAFSDTRRALATRMASADEMWQCLGCKKWFQSKHARSIHWGIRASCKALSRKPTEQPVASIEPIAAAVALNEDRPALFRRDERKGAALNMTTTCRYEKLMPDSCVQYIKEELEASVLPVVRQQLKERLSPHCKDLRPDQLESIISECTDIFGGMQTDTQEQGALKELLREYLVEPRRRLLGTRSVQSVDAEGVAFGPVREKSDYCWDLPAEETIQRLLQRVPRALHEILAHARAMDVRAQNAEEDEEEERTYADVCDGSLYREHPRVGDAARRANPCFAPGAALPSRLELATGGYYDDVEPFGPLGAARVTKKLACFYYQLFDLAPATRGSLLFITPHTYAYAKDVAHWGPKVLVGDPSSPNWDKPLSEGGCSSFGASMARFEKGIQMQIFSAGALHTLPVHNSLLLYHADQPAAAAAGPWKRGTMARRPCRRTMLDTDDSVWRTPSSYLDANEDLTQKWELRTEEQLANMEQEYDQLVRRGSRAALAAAEEKLKEWGINSDWAFNYPVKHFKNFKVTAAMIQDVMHNNLEGKCTKEVAAFIFLGIRYDIFTLDAFNARLRHAVFVAV